jgi:hypothetical protein
MYDILNTIQTLRFSRAELHVVLRTSDFKLMSVMCNPWATGSCLSMDERLGNWKYFLLIKNTSNVHFTEGGTFKYKS